MSDTSPATPASEPASESFSVGSFQGFLEDDGAGMLTVVLRHENAFVAVDVTPEFGTGVSSLAIRSGFVGPA